MKTRGEDFLDFLGNGKTCHELDNELEDLELDEDWEECKITPADEYKYPIIRRYIKPEDNLEELNSNIAKKGGLNENGK